MVSLDALTGTPSQVSARRGFLTGASKQPASRVALGFVRDHLDAFGLRTSDLATLVKAREVTDLNQITHVYWTQQIQGIPVFGNGLRAHVDRRGRLIAVQGAPVAGASTQATRAAAPRITRAAAMKAAVGDVHGTAARDGASATRVWFMTAGGLRPGWATYTQPSGTAAYQHVIDAASGRTLYRRSTINFERGDALVHENYPGRPRSGVRRQAARRQPVQARLPPPHAPAGCGAATPRCGPTSTTTTRCRTGRRRGFRARASVRSSRSRRSRTAKGEQKCTVRYLCTWDPTTPHSWQKNKNQDGVQALYFTSKFAQWLKRAPFGFTGAMGNFERRGGDQVNVHTMDGAATYRGLPDGDHVNNANFNTPPDGQPPVMQMYLNQSPLPRRELEQRLRQHRPRVHPRPVQPVGGRLAGLLHAEQLPGRRDG